VARNAYGADLAAAAARIAVRLMACAAPKLAPRRPRTLALRELLKMAYRNGFGPCVSCRQVCGKGAFGNFAGMKIGPCLAGIQDARRSLQMALLAYAVARRGSQFHRIDNVTG